MAALQFPCTLFETQKRMNDYSARDMRCGDLSESQLKANFHLTNVSARVNPYSLTKITPFSRPQSMFHGSHAEGEKITRQQCTQILFDEFRDLSRAFSVYGPYRHLIEKMITHMQYGNGQPFRNISLDRALYEQILNDRTEKSTLLKIKYILNKIIDWENNRLMSRGIKEVTDAILDGKLPKFDRLRDNLNGMGITVHDTWATHITLKSLHISNERYRAVVHYKVQDHFGLDNNDILKAKFSQFNFFRIWFVLQRYNQFGFKPYMTNMEATVEITGGRNEH